MSNPTWRGIGRGRGIRTPDILLPKQARYQTALYPGLAIPSGQARGVVHCRQAHRELSTQARPIMNPPRRPAWSSAMLADIGRMAVPTLIRTENTHAQRQPGSFRVALPRPRQRLGGAPPRPGDDPQRHRQQDRHPAAAGRADRSLCLEPVRQRVRRGHGRSQAVFHGRRDRRAGAGARWPRPAPGAAAPRRC
ncbi:hypothetical protein G6F40_014039 [Rhizopus arrhizus]|nr:hypothetical protein G6F40_014039 [Rhizopus arrhizus]